MTKFHVLILTLFLPFIINAQTLIKGKIIDSSSTEPIPFANVYLGNSKLGTTSNLDGSFSITVNGIDKIDLIVSYVGYETYVKSFKAGITDVDITIKLIENEIKLTEYEVNSKQDKEWQRQFQKFNDILIGEFGFGEQCTILNPWVLDFEEKKKVFKASANELLQIRNESLGYLLLYHIKDFEHTPNLTVYNGITSFSELEPTSLEQAKKWKGNRLIAYKGSLRHFFKSVLEDKLEENGFEAKYRSTILFQKNENQFIPEPGNIDLVNKNNLFSLKYNKKIIDFKKYVEIRYFDSQFATSSEVSWLKQAFETEINQQGILQNPAAIITYGKLAKEGLPYFLPIELNFKTEVSLSLPFKQKVVDSFIEFSSYNPEEKIHIQTDKDLYFKGEDLWLKAYVNLAGKPSPLSSKLYVTLSKDTIVVKNILSLDSGIANGYIHLDKDLPKGIYQLSAYTNWSDKSDKNYHFEKEIQIDIIEEDGLPFTKSEKCRISYFPEGGNIIENIENNIAFEVRNEENKLVSSSVKIIDDRNKIIADAPQIWSGKGKTSFKPKTGRTYQITSQDNLCDPVDLHVTKGLSIGVKVSSSDENLIINLACNNKSEQIVYLLITSDQKISTSRIFAFKDKKEIEIPLTELNDGVNQLTFFDIQLKPFAERLYFKSPSIEKDVTIALDQSVKKPRSSSNIGIDNYQSIQSASISVIDQSQTFDNGDESILVNTYLRPYLKGTVRGAANLFIDPSAQKEKFDLLMLTNGWRRYDWATITTENPVYATDSIDVLPGISITGKAYKSNEENTLENELIFLIVNDSVPSLNETFTDKEGNFTFNNIHYTDSSSLVFRNGDFKISKNVKYVFNEQSWLSSSVVQPEISSEKVKIAVEKLKESSDLREKLNQTYDFNGKTYYLKEAVIESKEEDIEYTQSRLWSAPDPEMIKFDILPDGEKINIFDVLNRNFAGIKAMVDLDAGGGRVFRVQLSRNQWYSLTGNNKSGMLLLIDNLPVTAKDLFMFNTQIVESVEVIKGPEAAVFGAQGANGAVLVYTKQEGQVSIKDKRPNFFKTKLKGYQKYKEFYSPNYTKKPEVYLPDYRTTLYWNPLIDSKTSTLKYFNHDNEGSMKIILEGFTKAGNPFRSTAFYQITN